MEEFMTVHEAAAALGVDPRTIQRRITHGEMAAQRIGHFYVIRASEIERWKPIGKRKGGRPRKQRPDTA
jgi:excisionase family DNA binding protein